MAMHFRSKKEGAQYAYETRQEMMRSGYYETWYSQTSCDAIFGEGVVTCVMAVTSVEKNIDTRGIVVDGITQCWLPLWAHWALVHLDRLEMSDCYKVFRLLRKHNVLLTDLPALFALDQYATGRGSEYDRFLRIQFCRGYLMLNDCVTSEVLNDI